MYNLLKKSSIFCAFLLLAGTVSAAVPSLSIRLQQPKTPTNIQELKIAVVTLDRLGRDVTVRCFKKGPSDGAFSQFGSDMVVIPGGNSVTCDTTSSFMNTNGTYQFQAVALAGSDTETSPTVSVELNTSGPGTPVNYAKDRVNTCDYRIKFRTANDSGKTVKVEVYRSENTSFDLNSGSRVDTLTLGSDTDGQSITTPPQCNKEYYFAVRAFDNAGNGSGSVGDSVIHTTTTTVITTASGTSGAAGGAIPAGTAGNVLGQQTGPTGGLDSAGSILGDATPSASPTPTAMTESKPFPTKTITTSVAVVLLLGLLYFLKKKKQQEL